MNSNVGAGILNVITESLYDNPIVTFREYVQNSVDSFKKTKIDSDNLQVNIIKKEVDGKISLMFIDNGSGIDNNLFEQTMIDIADSNKDRINNIGYKGIGRLSGISYCQKLHFINILNFKNRQFQKYEIDCIKYRTHKYDKIDINQLFNLIGSIKDINEFQSKFIDDIINSCSDMFSAHNSGFIVVLEDITPSLRDTILHKNFISDISWLLPVPFETETRNGFYTALFDELESSDNALVPAKSYQIKFDMAPLFRPLKEDMFRNFTNTVNLTYAMGFYSLKENAIEIDKKNPFTGIRIYIDNILLCDESEIIPVLLKTGLISHTTNELIQTVRGLGVIIYITDKSSLAANARRTFIEIGSDNSMEFLELLAEFIERIYKARYSLSTYKNALNENDILKERLDELKQSAIDSIKKLTQEEVILDIISTSNITNLDDKKRIARKKIASFMRSKINSYISSITDIKNIKDETLLTSFRHWLKSNLD